MNKCNNENHNNIEIQNEQFKEELILLKNRVNIYLIILNNSLILKEEQYLKEKQNLIIEINSIKKEFEIVINF